MAVSRRSEAHEFSNRARPALGADLRGQVRLILGLIIRDNRLSPADRKPLLQQLVWASEEFLILLRLAEDNNGNRNANHVENGNNKRALCVRRP